MKSNIPFPPRRPCPPGLPAAFPPAATDQDAVACPQVVTYLDRNPIARLRIALAVRLNRRRETRFPPGLGRPQAIWQADPFTLLLLADQEFAEGREEQASCLIDAAYDAFDRPHPPRHLRIVHDSTTPGR